MTQLFQLFSGATYVLHFAFTFRGIIFIRTLQRTELGDNIHCLLQGRLYWFRLKLILILMTLYRLTAKSKIPTAGFTKLSMLNH